MPPDVLPSLVTLDVQKLAPRDLPRASRTRRPVARQPICAPNGTLLGHEYLYRSADGLPVGVDGWVDERQEHASASVLASLFEGAGPDGDGLVFVNVTGSFLTGERALPAASRLVLEVVESVRASSAVLRGLPTLRDEGYAIAVDDYVATPDQVAMLPFADFVKVDLRDMARLTGRALDVARRYGARLVAEHVADARMLRTAVSYGFDLLQGDVLGAART
jgi:EAL and modified HD-GYP domain-containing signal transduction protein